MGLKTLLIAVFVALGFGGWPIVANYSEANSGWIGTIIFAVGTAIVFPLFLFSGQISMDSVPSKKGMLWLLTAAIVNGVAVFVYTPRLADKTTPVGPLVVTVPILMVACAVLLDWILNGVVLTPGKIFGFGFAAVAIYFLS